MIESPLDNIDEGLKPTLTVNPKKRALIYLCVMFFGELIVKYLMLVVIANMVLKNLPGYLFMSALMSLGTIFGIITVVEVLRYAWYKHKQRRSDQPLPDKDPLWFQIVESGFALWLLSVVAVVGITIYTYS